MHRSPMHEHKAILERLRDGRVIIEIVDARGRVCLSKDFGSYTDEEYDRLSALVDELAGEMGVRSLSLCLDRA